MRSFLAGFTIALLATTMAMAGMPSGPSPDSGMAGLWRIVGARQAPWAKPKKLTRVDAPLLEYAVEFGDGAVKGPAPPTRFKLYLRKDRRLNYHEAWIGEGEIVEHWGVCGEHGETRRRPTGARANAPSILAWTWLWSRSRPSAGRYGRRC